MRVPAIVRFAFSGLLLAASAGSAWAAEIILYDNRNFGGSSLTLNESVADLDDYNFDNEASSVVVVSGIWELFRDDNYESNNGPSVVLGPGEYPDLSDVGFRRNKLSSVRLNSGDDGNGQAEVDCPAPYQAPAPMNPALCMWLCSPGTQPGSNQECECQPGLFETSQDESGRRICTALNLDCPGPYQIDVGQAVCGYRCEEGTEVNLSTGECECRPGLVETGQFIGGRRVCAAPTEPTPPAPPTPPSHLCLPFDWQNLNMQNVNGRWSLTDRGRPFHDVGTKKAEAHRIRSIIRSYGMNELCFVSLHGGRPAMQYWLVGGQAPSGAMKSEKCRRFNLSRAVVRQVGGKWQIVDGNHAIIVFGPNRDEAEESMAIIKYYGFTHRCFVGGQRPSMTYFRN